MFSVRKSAVLLALVLVLAVVAVAAAQGTTTIQTANNAKLGQILVDSKGMTLYIYTKDTANTSNCTGTCLQNWPPLTVTAGQTPSAATGITGKLGTITRTDTGATQVTYNSMPLYFWVNDKAAGDATGQGVGGVWFVVNPVSGPVLQGTGTPAATGTAAAATGTATATRTATAAATAAATATRTATTAAAATATKAPSPATLPTTGGTADWTLPFLAFVALFLVAGLGFNLARRTR